MTAPFADDPAAAEQAAQEWADLYRITEAEDAQIKFAAKREASLLFRDLVAAAADFDDEDWHRRAMKRFYDRVAELDSDIVGTMLAFEMWPAACLQAQEDADVFGSALGELLTNPPEYKGRRRMCECQTPAYDGWGCSTCGGRIVQSGGVQ